ncbi:MAG: AAA family ATPase [Chloroflexi bacterium]|jgi:CO dehydrogenase maturation factor|nr:AAA family ATPase [Chloroflexota bacterium]MBT7081863.1 AAA family ATPase [Chloroflexota bacterium]MBT7289458.1 AAA family ATPase [Chloroflexota bacterium]
MSKTIAIAGKGGTGKTSISALLTNILSEKGVVLAIDGDPSTNLSIALGLPMESSIGRIREDMTVSVKKGTYDNSVPKPDYLQMKVMECLVESDKIDMLAMGRPEGPGCYCAANNMLRVAIDKIGENYDYVIIDCEAGMEHVSRQTTRDIDILLLVSDSSVKGLITASHMKDLIGELRTNVDRIGLVLNRVKSELLPEGQQIIDKAGLDLIETIPDDPNMAEVDGRGLPLSQLPKDSPLYKGVLSIVTKLAL